MRRALLALLLVGCSSKPATRTQPGECLTLPAAARRNLAADPAGGGLYWLEEAGSYDYDSQLTTYMNLVRYDVATRRAEVVLDHVERPLQFLRGKLLALRPTGETYSLVLVDRDHVQVLTPSYLGVIDVEPIDDHTVAVLADGDGPRAVYTLDLDRQRPHHLIDAGYLLSAAGGRVFAESGGLTIAIDPVTRKQTSFTVESNAAPLGDEVLFVQESRVKARAMPGGNLRTVISEQLPWKLLTQVGSVLARTAPANQLSHAYLVTGRDVDALPTVHGGASMIGAARLGGEVWALVAHNTSNYLGDFADEQPEADVCLLPKSRDVTFETRVVPKRYVDVATKLFDAAVKAAPNASVQVIDRPGAPTTVYFEVKQAGGADVAAMRVRVRELHQRVTSLLGEREAKTEVTFADRRTAFVRWRRLRLKRRVSVGMGDALLSDPSEFDLEVRDLVDKKVGDRITCSGTLVNLQARKLENLEVRCIGGDRKHVIAIAELAPSASQHFEQTFEVEPQAWTLFEVYKDREPIELRDATIEARMEKVLALATAVYDETALALISHTTEKELAVGLLAPKDFADKSEEEQEAAAAKAYQRYAGLRELYKLDAKTPLTLRIEVLLGSAHYEYDGVDFIQTQ